MSASWSRPHCGPVRSMVRAARMSRSAWVIAGPSRCPRGSAASGEHLALNLDDRAGVHELGVAGALTGLGEPVVQTRGGIALARVLHHHDRREGGAEVARDHVDGEVAVAAREDAAL